MFSVTAKAHFDSAHFLSGYVGKCANIHGHRWVVEAEVCGNLNDSGEEREMVADFSKVRDALFQIAEDFDHVFVYENGTISEELEEALYNEKFAVCAVPFRPTAENFALHFYVLLKDRKFDVSRVTVWETPETSATYRPIKNEVYEF
ncbi:MAG: 6-carboxytetrahydropterin synthase [Ruminococcus sp.]|jgi:6-pyruvoyltetrahydropterin/6-carboxytetrahydropterin synthase|nr:6-carboxytetrahydropterin synthase [Ruminococcus sp.]